MDGMLEESLHFGGEGEEGTVPEIVKRLDAQAVAGGEEDVAAEIPDGEGEHAAEAGQAIGAVLFVGVEDGFGVAVASVAMAGGFERRAGGGVVEDLAVIDDDEGAVLVGHGLAAAGEVDDAEAAVAEKSAGAVEKMRVVGAAVGDDAGHAGENGLGARWWGG